jgi:hypothetical protein
VRAHAVRLTEKSRPVGRSLKTQQRVLIAEARPKSDTGLQAKYVEVDIVPRYMRLEKVLPRKEVIQPQLPLRLPCYDFTPVTNPTFGGSLPCGLGHRLRVLPASVV